MTSKEILPLNKRLDRGQILELEGGRTINGRNKGTMFPPGFSITETLVAYHNALIAAENELEDDKVSKEDDPDVIILNKEDLQDILPLLPESFKKLHGL